MSQCDCCKNKLEHLPFNCRRCKDFFCHRCRLPGNHNCVNFVKGSFFKNQTVQNTRAFAYSTGHLDQRPLPFNKRKFVDANHKKPLWLKCLAQLRKLAKLTFWFVLILLIWNYRADIGSYMKTTLEKTSEFFDTLETTDIKASPTAAVTSGDTHSVISSISNTFYDENHWDKDACMIAFDYVNSVRQQFGRRQLTWDDRLYTLAYDRSKDMYYRNYFDHITPEGKSVKDFQEEAGISRFLNIAENAGGLRHYATGGVLESCKHAVDGWLASRGHRYNLLYESHYAGAVGCYRYICVFLGMNNEQYGLGSGPANTGEEGSAFWKSAPRQPGET